MFIRPFFRAAAGCFFLIIAAPAATTLTATASGWFASDGRNVRNTNNLLENYAAGWDPIDFSAGLVLRNFFVFNLAGVSGNIVSATLNLYVPSAKNDSGPGYLSFESSEPYQLTSTITSAADISQVYPPGSTQGLLIFNTLGTGTLFASTSVSAANEGTTLQIALNPAALTFLNNNEGKTIVFSGQDLSAPTSGPTSKDCSTCRFFFTNTDPLGSGLFKQTPKPTLTLNLAPVPAITNVISASGFGGFSAVAPGTWVEIYGSNLAPETRQWASSDFRGNNAPTSLDGVQVTIGGQNAFVDYISSSPGQINAQLPSNITPGASVPLTVTNGSQSSSAYNLTVNTTEPGLLAPAVFQIGGKQYVVALFPDGTYVLPTGAFSTVASRPAHPGETITLYGIGFGGVTPGIAAGQIVTQPNQLSASFQVLFAQTTTQVSYAGLAPNFVGLYQFNVVVPPIPDSDFVPLTFSLGGAISPQILYTSVHQ